MNNPNHADTLATPAAAPMTPVKGFITLVVMIAAISAFLLLNHLLGITEVWASFLFLIYWAGQKFQKKSAQLID